MKDKIFKILKQWKFSLLLLVIIFFSPFVLQILKKFIIPERIYFWIGISLFLCFAGFTYEVAKLIKKAKRKGK